ncbi:MAG TPA: hypothetical protein VMU84_02780 [Thermoanaerobaculia bacterium]|nr:hypothetical protein [Thermoanaerobaculia bacterium]
MSDHESERLRKEAIGLMWQGRVDDALVAYDEALALAESDDQRELVTIGKAEALIAAEREEAEVRELPAIVLRRRSPRHVYLAAYALMRRFSDKDRKRALFYGDVAAEAAAAMGDDEARAKVLNGSGILQMIESQFGDAIRSFEQAIELAKRVPAFIANLGGAKIHFGDLENGLALLNDALPQIEDLSARSDFELDLCYGYLQLERLDEARAAGERGFALADNDRLIRNSHYLLGEIAVRTERFDDAEAHFAALESYYPEFPNLRHLLLNVDLCPILNLKA